MVTQTINKSRSALLNNESNNVKEIVLIISLGFVIALSSFINISNITIWLFPILLFICAMQKPRSGVVALLVLSYLPSTGLGIAKPLILATLIVIIVNIKNLNRKRLMINLPLLRLYTIFVCWRFVSFFFVENIELFNSYFYISFAGLIHLYIISNLIVEKEDVTFVLNMWRIIGVVSAIVGFTHFLYHGNTYLDQLSIMNDNGINKTELDSDTIRWIWAGSEPNFLGVQLLIPLVINLYFLFNKISLYNILLTIISFIGILGTFSRSSFIVAIIALCMFFIFPSSSKNKYSTIIKLLILVIAVLSIYIMYSSAPLIIDRINSIPEAMTYGQGSGRYNLYLEAINNISTHPLLGIGTGQTAYVSKNQMETHNLFLQIFAENGLLGFIIIITIFYLYLKKSLTISSKKSLFFIAIFAVFLNANTVSFFDMRVLITLLVLLNYENFFQNYEFNKYQPVTK